MTPEEIQSYVDNRLEAKMEVIADLAAKKALQQVYAEVGRGVLKKAAWVVGVGILALLAWLGGSGHLKF